MGICYHCSVFAVNQQPSNDDLMKLAKSGSTKRKHKLESTLTKPYNHLNHMTLDFTYAGDVSGILLALKEYSLNTTILTPIGKKKEA